MKTTRTSEDKHLLLLIQQGNQFAFDALFRRYYPMLCAYGNRMVNLEDAEEIVQDVMLWLWESREIQIIETSLCQYLFKAVRNRAINLINRNHVKQKADTFFYEQTIELLHDTDSFQLEELTKRIQSAIDNLPASYREAFVMHRFREMSYKEIAGVLAVSAKTIDYRIQQALKLLRVELKDYLPLLLLLYG